MAIKRGAPVPDFIKNAPTVDTAAMLYIEAFYRLSTCRSYAGMEGIPTPIPWVTIHAYSAMMGWQGEEEARFTKIMALLDSWFLSRRQDGTSSSSKADADAK